MREFDSVLSAEVVEGDPGAAAQQTLAELVEGVRAGGGGVDSATLAGS